MTSRGHSTMTLLLALLMVLRMAPTALAVSCSSAPFFVCLAATQPSLLPNMTQLCSGLGTSLTAAGLTLPTSQACSTSQPTSPSLESSDGIYFLCFTSTSLTEYARFTISTWGLTSPSSNAAFQSGFLSMYNVTNRTSAAATLWSFFSCRHSRMPVGSVDGAWQLQFYTAGLQASPPPPQETARTAIVLTGSSTSGDVGRRLLLGQSAWGTSSLEGGDLLGDNSAVWETLLSGARSAVRTADLEVNMGAEGGLGEGLSDMAMRRLQQRLLPPSPPNGGGYIPPPGAPNVVTIFVVSQRITFASSRGLLGPLLDAISALELSPTAATVQSYQGGATLQAIFDSPAQGAVLLNYLSTAPGRDTYVSAARSNGGMPCGSFLVISDLSINAPGFSCNGGGISPIGTRTTALPSLCCDGTDTPTPTPTPRPTRLSPPPRPPPVPLPPPRPPVPARSPLRRPPAPPSPPLQPVPLDNATVTQFTNLAIRTLPQLPEAPLPAPVEFPNYMIVAPYLAPSFVDRYLGPNAPPGPSGRTLAVRYTDFVVGGGVLLVLSSFQSVGLNPSAVCTAPVALLTEVLGPSRLSNCSCGNVGPGDIAARLNSTAAAAVLGRQGADRLANVQGEDFPVSLPLVGGVPLTCSPNAQRNDFDLLPIASGRAPQPLLNFSGPLTPPAPTIFAKVNGSAPLPPGFRPVTCQEALQARQAILPYMNYLEICSVEGGTVRGNRTGFDNGPSNTILCPDPQPPPSFSCRIVAVTTSTPAPPPPPRPSPPLPPGAVPGPPPANVSILKLDINSPVPDGFRALTCAEAQRYQREVLEVVAANETCSLYTGSVTANLTRSPGSGAARRTLECGAVSEDKCKLVIRPSFNATLGSTLVKAWRLGAGWVIYAGANINVPNNTASYADAQFWNQFILSVNQIARAAMLGAGTSN